MQRDILVGVFVVLKVVAWVGVVEPWLDATAVLGDTKIKIHERVRFVLCLFIHR